MIFSFFQKPWEYLVARSKELSTHMALIIAAAIAAIQAANAISGRAAIAMFALVFIQAVIPEWKKPQQ